MGYRYQLQLDDDTIFLQDISYNLVSKMKGNGYKLAVTHKLWQDSTEYSAGLAEV